VTEQVATAKANASATRIGLRTGARARLNAGLERDELVGLQGAPDANDISSRNLAGSGAILTDACTQNVGAVDQNAQFGGRQRKLCSAILRCYAR
jgi:hypothetical protein